MSELKLALSTPTEWNWSNWAKGERRVNVDAFWRCQNVDGVNRNLSLEPWVLLLSCEPLLYCNDAVLLFRWRWMQCPSSPSKKTLLGISKTSSIQNTAKVGTFLLDAVLARTSHTRRKNIFSWQLVTCTCSSTSAVHHRPGYYMTMRCDDYLRQSQPWSYLGCLHFESISYRRNSPSKVVTAIAATTSIHRITTDLFRPQAFRLLQFLNLLCFVGSVGARVTALSLLLQPVHIGVIGSCVETGDLYEDWMQITSPISKVLRRWMLRDQRKKARIVWKVMTSFLYKL